MRSFKNFISLKKVENKKIKWRNFDFIIKTRAPLHIASIESQ